MAKRNQSAETEATQPQKAPSLIQYERGGDFVTARANLKEAYQRLLVALEREYRDELNAIDVGIAREKTGLPMEPVAEAPVED